MIQRMKLWRPKVSPVLILVAVLLALLPVLAFLQYHWLGQVSQAERERMQSNLSMAISRFRQDFDREIARVFLHFQAEGVFSREEIEARYGAKLADWKSKSPNPRLIRELFWIDGERLSQLSISRFDLSSGKLSPTSWPDEFASWRDQMRTSPATQTSPLNSIQMILDDVVRRHGQNGSGTGTVHSQDGASAKEANPGDRVIEVRRPVGSLVSIFGKAGVLSDGPQTRILPRILPRILEDGPALVVPVQDRTVAATKQSAQSPSMLGYVLVKLDLDYLRSELIPALVERYFQTAHGLDYQVLVTSRRDPGNILYRSSPSVVSGIADSNDGSSGLLAIKPEDFGNLLADGMATSSQIALDHMTRADRVTLRVFSRSATGASKPASIPEIDGYWQVFFKHRAGSLEAAVTSVRRRSLVISFGILVLLSASIILLLVSTRRAQRLAAQQMEFVAGVSHELRTPLAVIRSAAENLADGYIEGADHIKRYGVLIRDEGRRLTDMVEQVLEVAGVHSGRRSYQMHRLDPRSLIEQALGASNPLIAEHGFDLELEIAKEVPLINGDTAALSRALQNLISNSVKYSAESRWLRLQVDTIKDSDLSWLRIRVEDRGIGIAAADLPHVFEPFYRAGTVLSAQIHGSGLGLSLVKHIIESHGGRVVVESNLGKGTVFTVLLPPTETNQTIVELAEGYEQAHSAD